MTFFDLSWWKTTSILGAGVPGRPAVQSEGPRFRGWLSLSCRARRAPWPPSPPPCPALASPPDSCRESAPVTFRGRNPDLSRRQK